ncbi:hypothetical protein AYO39_01965 [Actinobacteria bacterium SCGC AG-212-D09]|nr:hypothetical protein AYO39_01965 [Actinobacteria bacterium SCGC AG-212-D09]
MIAAGHSKPARDPREKKRKGAGGEKRKGTGFEDEIERLRRLVARLARAQGPVLAGPFTGEVGFELLYWIPLLRWVVREFPELRGRLVVISRGGVQSWLEGLDARYVDILSLFSTEQFARHRALSDKQRDVKEFEEEVITAVKRELDCPDAEVLHPSVLYQFYFRILKINQLAYVRSVVSRDSHLEGLTSVYEPIPRPDRSQLPLELPDDYVAVRFYSRDSFPDSPESAGFAAAVIEALGRTTNVVLIGNRIALDEHRDVSGKLPEGVITIDHLLRPEDNLAVQTAVVAHATALVGTYGGFSYLAPFLGVPSISFSIDRKLTQSWHYELAQRIFEAPPWGDFLAVRHNDLALMELVTRGFRPAGVPTSWAASATLALEGGVRPDQSRESSAGAL